MPGVAVWTTDALYRETPALYAQDTTPEGFRWLESDAADTSSFAFARFGREENEMAIVVSNFTPVVRDGYRVGVPKPGFYRERLNTDAAIYGGSDIGNGGGLHSDEVPHHGHAHSLRITLPPLATVIFTYGGSDSH